MKRRNQFWRLEFSLELQYIVKATIKYTYKMFAVVYGNEDGVVVVTPAVTMDFGMDRPLPVLLLALVNGTVLIRTSISNVSDDRRFNRWNTLMEALVVIVDSVLRNDGIETKRFIIEWFDGVVEVGSCRNDDRMYEPFYFSLLLMTRYRKTVAQRDDDSFQYWYLYLPTDNRWILFFYFWFRQSIFSFTKLHISHY